MIARRCTLVFSVAAIVAATVVLVILPLLHVRFVPREPILLVYLIPQALALAVPVGITLGILLGLRGHIVSRRSTGAVLACASLCSLVCLAMLAWILPLANHEFRLLLSGWTVALAAFGACFSYYLLMWVGRAAALQDTVPALVGAWLPNAVSAVVSVALLKRRHPSRAQSPEPEV